MMFAPLEGWRHVKVTDRHTAVDYAHVLKELADTHFANAKEFLPKRLDYIDEEGDSAFQRGMNQRIEARIVWTIIQMGPASGLLSQPIPSLMKAVRALECHQ